MIHNKFRYLLTLVALFAISTGAWAEGTVYTGSVAITSLKVGDILTEGASITGSGVIYFDVNRFKWNGILQTEGTSYLYTDDFDSFGAEGVISLSNNSTISPVDKDNNDGNAWEVTNVHIEENNNRINIQGITYAPAVIEVNGPTIVEGKPQWTFTQPGSDVVLTPEYYPGMLTLPASLTGGKLEVVGLTGPFTKLEVLDAWKDDNTLLSATHLSGLKEMTDAEAQNWTDVPSGYVILIYGFDGTKAKLAPYIDGELTFPSSEEVILSQLKEQSAVAEIYYSSEAQLPAGFEKDEEGNIYVEPGTEFQVKAVPAEDYHLVSLTDGTNDIEVDADGIATITMPDEYADLTLTATFAENTYNVTFADDTAEPTLWTASPAAGVKKGQTVTVTYTGTKKVLGVKAEKKASAKTLSEATLEDIGKIAGADGNIYDTKAAAEAVATGNAVAMIAYVGSASDCTHGLAIALADESGTKTWSEAGAACSGKTAVTGGTWRLPSIKDWQYMFIGCGASGSYSDSPSTMSYSELATKLTTANGTALQTVSYWSSTESSPGEDAWSLYFGGSSASFFSGDYEGGAYPIRACLAF